MNNSLQCPICGSVISNKEVNQESSTINNSIPASIATIDIIAKEAEDEEFK